MSRAARNRAGWLRRSPRGQRWQRAMRRAVDLVTIRFDLRDALRFRRK
jgi:hypothetical protein